MKLDLDLLREILLYVEDKGDGLHSFIVDIDGYSYEEACYHVNLLVGEGLIVGVNVTHSTSPGKEWRVNDLTMQGHQFCDIVRDQTSFNRVKESIERRGSQTLAEAISAAILDDKNKNAGVVSVQNIKNSVTHRGLSDSSQQVVSGGNMMISYEAFIAELRGLVLKGEQLIEVEEFDLNEDFRDWRHEVTELIKRIEQQGWPVSSGIKYRTFGGNIKTYYDKAGEKRKNTFQLHMKDTIRELKTIIDHNEKLGAPPQHVEKIESQKSIENLTVRELISSLKVDHLRIVIGVLITVIVGSIGLGYKLSDYLSESKIAQNEAQVNTLEEKIKQFRGLQTKERFLGLYLQHLIASEKANITPSEANAKNRSEAADHFREYIEELLQRGERESEEIDLRGLFLGKGGDKEATVKFGYDGTVWPVPSEFGFYAEE